MPNYSKWQQDTARHLINLATTSDDEPIVHYHDLFQAVTGLDAKTEYANYKHEFEIRILGDISYECIRLKLPILSTLVTLKGEGRPGAMYFTEFKKELGKSKMQNEDFWMEQFTLVRGCNDWSALEKSLGLQPSSNDMPVPNPPASPDILNEYKEGLLVHKEVESRQRNKTVIKKFIRGKKRRGEYKCEICEEPPPSYQGLDTSVMEAHHKIPLKDIQGEHTVTEDDFALACPNCHRICHRNPDKTIEQIKAIVRSSKPTI